MSNEEFTTFETGGMKHSKNKLRTDLLPPEAIESIAEGLTYGAEKYADRNWEKGIPDDVIIGSILRHLLKIMKGIEIDEESGLPHHVHLITNAAFLTTFAKRRNVERTKSQYVPADKSPTTIQDIVPALGKLNFYSSPLC